MNFQSVTYEYILRWEEDTVSHSQAGFQGGHTIRDDGDQGTLQSEKLLNGCILQTCFHRYLKVHLCIYRVIPIFTKKYKHCNFATP